jgi:hypothetical protein
MQKITGVTSVKVSLNDGLTILELAPNNEVTLAQLRQVIRNNGFVTNESLIVARGALTNSGAAAFEVRGSKERFTLQAAREAAGDVVINGSVNTKDPKTMTLSIHKIAPP